MKKFFKEFKEFAIKSNAFALSVGVIVGGAFQSVVTSLTNNILSPIISIFVRGNFDALTLNVFGVSIMYGAFITSVINFIIMAFVTFLIVKAINGLTSAVKKDEPETQTPPPRICPYCKSEIHKDATRCPKCTSDLAPDA